MPTTKNPALVFYDRFGNAVKDTNNDNLADTTDSVEIAGVNDNSDTNDKLENPNWDNSEIPGVHEIPGVNKNQGAEETPDPTGGAEDLNPDASFPPFPPLPDTKDVKIIQPNTEQVIVEDVLEGEEKPDIDIDTSNAKNDNNNDDNNVKSNTTINDNDEDNDNKTFQPSNSSLSEKLAWKYTRMQLPKIRRLSYSHLHNDEK